MQGYALVEFALKEEAEKAIKGTTGSTFLEKTITTSVICFQDRLWCVRSSCEVGVQGVCILERIGRGTEGDGTD